MGDESGVRGVLSRKTLEELPPHDARRLKDLLTTVEFVHVHADHPLIVALERLGATRLGILPVVSRADVHELVGIVTLPDVLALYGVGEGTQTK